MTDDQMIRAAIVGGFSAAVGLFLGRRKDKLSGSGGQQRRGVANRLGYWLGDLWSRAHRGAKR